MNQVNITTESISGRTEAPQSSASGSGGLPGPLVAVAKYRFRSARTPWLPWLWNGIPANILPLEVVRLSEALEKEHPTDAHFVGYVAYDVAGANIVQRQARVSRDQLEDVRRHGFELQHHALVAGVELPGYATIAAERLEDASAKLSELTTVGWYASRGRLTILQPLSTPISPERYEAIVPAWLDALQAVLGRPWVVDRASEDWTQEFRLPKVTTGRAPTRRGGRIDFMLPIAAPADAPSAGPGHTNVSQDMALRPSSDTGEASSSIVRAWACVETVQNPACGGGQCTKAAYRVACALVGRFRLSEDDALVLLAAWASKGSHRFAPRTLRRVVKDAAARAADGPTATGGAP